MTREDVLHETGAVESLRWARPAVRVPDSLVTVGGSDDARRADRCTRHTAGLCQNRRAPIVAASLVTPTIVRILVNRITTSPCRTRALCPTTSPKLDRDADAVLPVVRETRGMIDIVLEERTPPRRRFDRERARKIPRQPPAI